MLNKKYLSISFAALIAGAGCGKTADDDTNNVANNTNNENNVSAECQVTDIQGSFGGAITDDITFCGVVVIEDNPYNSKAGINISARPGTVIKFPADSYADFGWAGNEATVKFQGTAEKPIILEGTSPNAGHWLGLNILSNVTSDSVLENVVIRHAGSEDAALNIDNERGILVKDVTIEQSGGIGVAASSFKTGSANVSVKDSEGPAFELRHSLAVTNFPIGGTFEGNTENVIAVKFDAVTTDVTWKNAGLPYLMLNGLYNSDEIDFTVEAGVNFIMAADTQVQLGWAANSATVAFNGTAEAPITFVGRTAEPGHWLGLLITDRASTASTFNFVEIRHAGSTDEYAFDINAAVKLNDITLAENLGPSLRIETDGLKEGSANLTIVDNDGASAEVHVNALPTLPLGGSYGSADAYVDIINGALEKSGTISKLDVPYRVSTEIYNPADNVEIEVETGTRFEFGADTTLNLGWAGNTISFQADGVEFVGFDPTPGYWAGIIVSSAVMTGSFIKNSTISHAKDIAVDIQKESGFEFTGNTVTDTTGYCLAHDAADTADYAGSNTLSCSQGDVQPL